MARRGPFAPRPQRQGSRLPLVFALLVAAMSTDGMTPELAPDVKFFPKSPLGHDACPTLTGLRSHDGSSPSERADAGSTHWLHNTSAKPAASTNASEDDHAAHTNTHMHTHQWQMRGELEPS